LCQSIISQQVSTAAARSMYRKFRFLFPSRRPSAAMLLELGDKELRGAGLSRQKVEYVRGIAEAFIDGRVPVRRLWRMSDEEAIEALVPLRGVGRWTAEMFLIFVLQRPDVLPVDDLGLQVGMQKLFKLPQRPKGRDLIPLAERWRPYRSVATWYLWRGM
jgi:DNA-3-methyladenine glycosylase II